MRLLTGILAYECSSMFTKQDEKCLIRGLARNEVLLFLGAGFSMMATNSLGETLSNRKGFSKKI